jgi:hypothetical protein
MTEGLRPHPEGLLLKAAAERLDYSGHQVAARTRLSPKAMARLGYSKPKLSESGWRCNINGFQWANRAKVPYSGAGETVARFAQAVGVTAEELEAAGRGDAAEALRELEAVLAAVEKEQRDADAARRASGAPARVEERWLMLEPVLRQAPVGLDAFERDDLRGRVDGLLTESPQWQSSQEAEPAARRGGRKTAKGSKASKGPKSSKGSNGSKQG